MILREFLYLDEQKLDQYLSQVEDGLRSTASTGVRRGTSTGGKLDAKLISAQREGTNTVDETTSRVDTGGSRFDRLVSLISGHQDEVGWLEVLSEADFALVRPRAILELDVELAGGSDLDLIKPGGLLGQFTALANAASALGATDAQRMPSGEQLEALRALGEQMQGRLMRGLALTDESTTVYGMLREEASPRPLEGDARIVGKVQTIVPAGAWALPPNMPMLASLPRDKRREMTRSGPQTEEAAKLWIRGPAIELDLLAIWN